MAYVAFTDINGKQVRWDPTTVAAIVPVAEDINAPVARSRLLSGSGDETIVNGTALATATALGLQTSPALTIVQSLSGPTTLGGASAYVVPGSAPSLDAYVDPLSPSTAYTRIAWADGSSIVVTGTPAAIAALIAGLALDGSRFVCGAIILPDGTIAAQRSDTGTTLSLTNAHVADSGLYEFTLSGGEVPTAYLIQPVLLAGIGVVTTARATGSGAPTSLVSWSFPSKEIAAGLVNAAGAVQAGSYGFSAARVSAGVYDLTLDDAPAGGFVCQPQQSANPADSFGISAAKTSATVARVTVVDETGAAVDSEFTAVFSAQDPATSGYRPVDPTFSIVFTSLDAT